MEISTDKQSISIPSAMPVLGKFTEFLNKPMMNCDKHCWIVCHCYGLVCGSLYLLIILLSEYMGSNFKN